MMEWPDLDELKQVLDVTSEEWDGDDGSDPSRLTAVLQAAIDRVKGDVGLWDESIDLPDFGLNRAALRMAELMAQRPESDEDLSADRTYRAYLTGHRKRFPIG